MDFKTLLSRVTPGPWMHRRRNEDDAGFVEAKVRGKPYSQEILGDDYWQHLDRAADCAYIARLNPEVMRQVVEAMELLENHPGIAMPDSVREELQAALSALNGPGPKEQT